MKLYTEEQVMNALKLAHSNITSLQNIIDRHLTPIELPSDEEIEQHAEENTAESNGTLEFERGFKRGAKWMRDKIQGGNK
jgi:hypothetical protein